MSQRHPIQLAAITLVVMWTLAVVVQHGISTGQWLATIGQTLVLFGVTAALAWAGASSDNLIDELIARGRGGSGGPGDGAQPGGRRAWRIHVPVEVTAKDDDTPRP